MTDTTNDLAIDVTGACLCGAIRVSCVGGVGDAGICHCADCRRCTGSAFNVSVPVERSRFTVTRGAPRAFTATADNGNAVTRYFCGDCGSPIHTASSAHPDRVFVKAGIIDDPSVVRPAIERWTASAVPWARLDGTLPSTERD